MVNKTIPLAFLEVKMKKAAFLILLITLPTLLFGQRIKDIAYLTGAGTEQVIGYGLVVGLAGTGDSHRSSFTVQSVVSMLKRFGITIPDAELKTKNVAAVMVTASLNSNYKSGASFDVNVSSLGDATSLMGGTLLITPLSGMNGVVYGFAQGSISVGGYDINTSTGNRVAKNHTLAGRVPRGGNLKVSIREDNTPQNELSLFLRDPDLTTSNNVSNAINQKFGQNTAASIDAGEIKIVVPAANQTNIVGFLAELEGLQVQVDYIAKVVLNERTGTVVSGANVKIQPVTISHGSLNLTIRSYPTISQPNPFSNGRTEVFNNMIPYVSQDSTNAIAIQGATNVQEVAAALNSLKVSPKDIIAIFQALKEAGALVAELVII